MASFEKPPVKKRKLEKKNVDKKIWEIFFFLKIIWTYGTYQKFFSSISDKKKFVGHIFHFSGYIKSTISQKLKIREFIYYFSRSSRTFRIIYTDRQYIQYRIIKKKLTGEIL